MKKSCICAVLALLMMIQLFIPAYAEEDTATADNNTETTEEAEKIFDPFEDEYAVENDPQYYKEYEKQFGTSADAYTTFDDYTPRALQSGETLRKGIDVSFWQGTIDWEAVAASGVEFAFIRCGYRTSGDGTLHTDTQFEANMSGAIAAGIKVGVYMFSQAITLDEAEEEAEYALNLVNGYHLDLPIVMDYEYISGSGGLSGRLYKANLTAEEATAECLKFCETVSSAGYSGAIYCSKSLLEDYLDASQLGCVWLAHYTTKTNYAGDYDFWQCGATGKIDGIESDGTDIDFWFDDGSFGAPVVTVPSPQITLPFTDVPKSYWAYSYIAEAYNRGIINGIDATTFGPEETSTRGQVATMLYRMVGQPAVSGTPTFIDLSESYYMNAIQWAQSKGIVTGYSSDIFAPNAEVTRQDLVTMLYRLAGKPACSGSLSAYSDAGSVADYAKDAMIWAVNKGIISGRSSTTLAPRVSTTRAETATILIRYCSLMGI